MIEFIAIGDELLLGHTIDTNAAWLGRELASVGYSMVRRATIGDDAAAIRSAVRDALERAEVVICSGGLGPTQDDVTRPAVADLFGVPLVVNQDLLAALEARFRKRGMPMPSRNITQAEVPEGAEILPNARGTAPGLLLRDHRGRRVILLPGVPHEFRGLVTEQVLPKLLAELPPRGSPVFYRTLRTTGIAESLIAEKVDDVLAAVAPLSVAFLPGFTGSDIRLTSWGMLDENAANVAFDRAEALIRERVGRWIYGTDNTNLADVVGDLLRTRGLTVRVAESCTGGLLGKRLTDTAGSSDYFDRGVVTYSNESKLDLLGVKPETLAAHGAVSQETVREMALGILSPVRGAAIAITGIAGPGGGSAEKPVGTVWLAAAIRKDIANVRVVEKLAVLPGDREEIRERAAQAGLALLWNLLRDEP